MRTLYRRVALVAIWRRPKLTARGDPCHDHVVAGIVARLIVLPRRAVGLPAGPPPRGRLHRLAEHAYRGVPAGSGDRGDL